MPDSLAEHGAFAELIGYRLTAWRTDQAEVVLEVEERHMNRSGILHGGVMATLIDTACGYAGCYRPAPPEDSRRASTLSLTTSFIGPVVAGAELVARARRTGGGRQIFFADCEVRDQDGHLVATGSGSFKYRRAGAPPR